MKQQKMEIEKLIESARTRSSASAAHVELIAVTKELNLEQTQKVVDEGLIHLGENRPDGLLSKVNALSEKVVWHYIGSLQTRKVKTVIDHIDYLHSLDRLSLAEEIQKRASRPVRCFIQVNVSGEQSKQGMAAEEVELFLETIKDMSFIHPIGFMTMAPIDATESQIRTYFSNLRKLRDTLQHSHPNLQELSMGMSGDYEIAVEEGATFVRIGTALVASLKE